MEEDDKDYIEIRFDSIKQRIEYLETNNPNHVTLELVKQRITDYISAEDKI